MSGPDADATARVRAFWEAEACGERFGADQDRVRYQLEPEILAFADFPSAAGRRVLEVGVGMGADFVRFARFAAAATGVDLTGRAVDLTRERLAAAGLDADVHRADAERLPFADASFDLVYSWGVLHHAPDPERAIAETVRVLAPGGTLRLMLYHRRSWVAVAAWARFGLLRGRPWLNLRQAVGLVESPGTRAFTRREVHAALGGRLASLAVRPVLTHWDRRVAPGLARLLGDRFGWFLLIEGRKAGGSG